MALPEDVGDVRYAQSFEAILRDPVVLAARAECGRRGVPNWTANRIEALMLLWREGFSSPQIAKSLGGITRNAVIGKLYRLGMAGRAQVYKPVVKPMRRRTAPRRAPQPPKPAPALPGALAPIAALAPLLLETGKPAVVLTATDAMCKYGIGDPLEPDFAFCGRAVTGGHSWCAAHAKLVYERDPGRKKARRRAVNGARDTKLRQFERPMNPGGPSIVSRWDY